MLEALPPRFSASTNSIANKKDFFKGSKAKGYYPGYSSIGNELSTTGILDIVGTILFIFPAIGLFFPGAKTLDRQNVAIDLVPVEQ